MIPSLLLGLLAIAALIGWLARADERAAQRRIDEYLTETRRMQDAELRRWAERRERVRERCGRVA